MDDKSLLVMKGSCAQKFCSSLVELNSNSKEFTNTHLTL